MNTTRYFGKCKACKAVKVVDALNGNSYLCRWNQTANFFLGPFACAVDDGYFACNCGRQMNWTALKATFSAKHECGAKCINSKGPTCECSCRGKNHGNGHQAAA